MGRESGRIAGHTKGSWGSIIVESGLAMGDDNGGKNPRDRRRGHALVIPLSTQAHIASCLKLAKALGSCGVKITFVSRQKPISRIESSHSPEELRRLNLHLVALADRDPDRVPFLNAVNLKRDFAPYLEKILADREAGIEGPTCMISDRFLVWSTDVAKQLQIPRYVFFSCAATSARLMVGFYELSCQETLRIKEGWMENLDEVTKLPGLEFCRAEDIPRGAHKTEVFESCVAIGASVVEAEGVILNSFYELEALPIDTLKSACRGFFPERTPKVFSVGPISAAGTVTSFVSGLSVPDTASLQWLDAQPESSVLYVCLGSLVRLVQEQILELALALESSQQRFLWVLHSDSSLEDLLPAGYVERVSGRGRVESGWVPQIQVLAHLSIKGFLSHCGWNSSLEAITAGVPILGWPFTADQHMNCRYLVETCKTAVKVFQNQVDHTLHFLSWKKTGVDADIIVKQAEFEVGIKLLMVDEAGRDMTLRAQDLKAKAHAAMETDGSSQRNIHELVQQINSF